MRLIRSSDDPNSDNEVSMAAAEPNQKVLLAWDDDEVFQRFAEYGRAQLTQFVIKNIATTLKAGSQQRRGFVRRWAEQGRRRVERNPRGRPQSNSPRPRCHRLVRARDGATFIAGAVSWLVGYVAASTYAGLSQLMSALVATAWCAITLTLDRATVSAATKRRWRWRSNYAIVPRLTLAAVMALVISTPLLFHVTQDDLRQQRVPSADGRQRTPLAQPAPAGVPPPTLRPVQIVVLVDESGSISPVDIEREADAARMIALGELSPQSTVSVVGFGSENGLPGSSPVDPYCPPTRLDSAANQQFLAECVGRLHRRQEDEGNGTDHVNALRQALNYLREGAPTEPKIIFLLTDGKLNVESSSSFGATLSGPERTEAARQQIPGLLKELDQAGVQVWPIGFGAVDLAQLDAIAAGAARTGCGLATPRPRAVVINSSADLHKAIDEAYSAARCVELGQTAPAALAPAPATMLSVTIPEIATDGSILVFKHDPAVHVTYFDPAGNLVPPSGAFEGSTFDLSGQNSPVESLRIVDPAPGEWSIRLASAPGAATQDVVATVVFQGAVRAALSVSPPVPAAGQVVDVRMQLRTRRGPISDPELLRALAFKAGLRGEGFTLSTDLANSDGQYEGQLTVPPGASGALTFTGNVSGVGISGDEQVFHTRVADGTRPLMLGNVVLTDFDSDVVLGSSVPGMASVTNNTGVPKRLRLLVVDPAQGTALTVEPAVLGSAPPGESSLPFLLRFGPDTKLGPNQAVLRLVDATDPTAVLAELPVRTVVGKPLIPFRLVWLLGAAAGVAPLAAGAAVAVAQFRRRQRRRRIPPNLQLRLVHRETPIPRALTPRKNDTKVFPFVISPDGSSYRLAYPSTADGEQFVLQQTARSRELILTSLPENDKHSITLGALWDVPGYDELQLEVIAQFTSASPRAPAPAAPQPPWGW